MSSNFEYAALPPGPFSTIVADLPWDYSRKLSGGGTSGFSPVHPSRSGNRGAANHYSTLTMGELAALPVCEVVADKAHLYLWTTGAFIVEAHPTRCFGADRFCALRCIPGFTPTPPLTRHAPPGAPCGASRHPDPVGPLHTTISPLRLSLKKGRELLAPPIRQLSNRRRKSWALRFYGWPSTGTGSSR